MKKQLVLIASAFAVSGSLTLAQAQDTVTTTFGPLSGATFSGTGEPNNPVEITTDTDGRNTVTLGLAAQQRYNNAPVTSPSAGIFDVVAPGLNDGNPATPNDGAHAAGTTWNFDFYINNTGGSFANDTFKLLYDFTPGVNTPASELGTLNFGTVSGTEQDSENLYFGFLAESLPGITPPSGGSTTFDPNAVGEYSFILEMVNSDNTVLAQSDIQVEVGAVPDTASNALLLCAALGSLVAFRRRLAA